MAFGGQREGDAEEGGDVVAAFGGEAADRAGVGLDEEGVRGLPGGAGEDEGEERRCGGEAVRGLHGDRS